MSIRELQVALATVGLYLAFAGSAVASSLDGEWGDDDAADSWGEPVDVIHLDPGPGVRDEDFGSAREPVRVIDEMVVTARRIEERQIDVPISMTVLDGGALSDAGLTLVTDIQERVPGLVVSVPNPRLTSFTIRGLGSNSGNDGLESSVGVFLDGVYLGRQGLSVFDLVDIERVEVLRGPQGTLFGKNTTAGAINVVTRQPSQDFEANIEGTAGNFGLRQLRGSVTGPLLQDTLAGRLTAYVSQRDGTIHNVFDDSRLNDRDKHGVRGQLLWTPTGSLSARFIAEYGNTSEACCVYPLIAPVRPAVQARDDFMEYTRPSLNPYDRLADSDGETSISVRQKAASAEVNWHLGDRHRLVSISAFRDWYFRPVNDDATSLRLTRSGTLNEHRQYSQEFRFESSFDRFQSVVGVFALRQDFAGREQVVLGPDMGGWVFGGLLREGTGLPLTESNFGPLLYAVIPRRVLDGMTITTPYTQVTDSLAGFASVNWHLSSRLDLTTGLRYTYEWRDAEVSRSRTGGCPNCTVLSLIGPVFGAIGLEELTIDGLLDSVAGGEFHRANKRNEGNLSGQVSLSYKLGPDLIAYGSVGHGYKAGGINLGVTGDSVSPTFEPETATAYELGIKGQFFDRLLMASLAVYHTDVRDYQALTFDEEQTIIPNPRQINLLNVGRVRLRGAELEALARPLSGLSLRGGVAYSRAVTLDFPNAPDEDARDNSRDLSGRTLYNAPRWTLTAGAEYGVYVGHRLEAYGAVDYAYRSGYFATVEQGRASYIDAYGLTNLRLGLRDAGQSWDVSLFARNVFDEQYTAAVLALYGVGDYGATAGDGRTFGVVVRLNFR